MSPPLPLPPKAAIRALRGIALGTSCAIGVIVEDRRRRICTLKTAVANKQRLQSSRHYHHGGLEGLVWPLGGAAAPEHNLEPSLEPSLGHDLQCGDKGESEPESEPTEHRSAEAAHRVPFGDAAAVDNIQHPLGQEYDADPIQRWGPSAPQSSPPRPAAFEYHLFAARNHLQSLQAAGRMNAPDGRTTETRRPTLSAALQVSRAELIRSIEDLLAGSDEKSFDRAVSLFMARRPPEPSSPLLDKWIDLSARISRKCQANGRWEDASRILATIIESRQLNEFQYFAHNPLPTIRALLRREDPNIPLHTDRVRTAAKLLVTKFDWTNPTYGVHVESAAKLLIREALSSRLLGLSRDIYFRTLHWAPKPVEFVGWAIQIFFEYGDHKGVVRMFLLHYSRMRPAYEHFNKAMDCVLGSITALKGLNADVLLETFAKMSCPGNGKLRSRWVMRLFTAHWERYGDASKLAEFFDKAVSLGILRKVTHPQGLYRTFVDLIIEAGDAKTAYCYANKLVSDYPEEKDSVSLKLAKLEAQAGNWDSVFHTFRQVRPSDIYEPEAYVMSFVPVLKIFAKSHSAAETKDFAMRIIREVGIEWHRYVASLIADKYGEDRDMEGFMAWLKFCSQEGFAIDPSFCNIVLHHCSTTWKLCYSELQTIHSQLMALNPYCSDEITQRILSQAALRERRAPPKRNAKSKITANRLAYRGRSTNAYDVYEAMNQEMLNNRFSTAVMIYKRAISYGMPINGHCLRLAVSAALRGKGYGHGSALSLIQEARAKGHDVAAAVSIFIKHEIDTITGDGPDAITRMRNLLSHMEASEVPISPDALAHMAAICNKIGQHDKAIVLCNMARDRSGASRPFFSRQSFGALAVAYSRLLDIEGMASLLHNLSGGEYAADKTVLSYLRSARRYVRREADSDRKRAMMKILDHGITQLTGTRAKVRAEGKLISHETLRIMGDALAHLQEDEAKKTTASSHTPPDEESILDWYTPVEEESTVGSYTPLDEESIPGWRVPAVEGTAPQPHTPTSEQSISQPCTPTDEESKSQPYTPANITELGVLGSRWEPTKQDPIMTKKAKKAFRLVSMV